jgi:hypothetical protein
MDNRLGFSVFVRDEIQSIPDLLESVRPYFDEITVLHTGDDNPVWKHLRHLEKTWFPQFRPYRLNIPFDAEHFHFGYARSVAAHLNKCGYVMMLDADERMTAKSLARIRDYWHPLMLKNKWDALAFPRRAWRDGPTEMQDQDTSPYPDLQIRLIRNDGTVWWRRPVHEACLYGPDGVPANVVQTGEHINHFHSHYREAHGTLNAHHMIYAALALSDAEWIESLYCIYPMLRNAADIERLYTKILGQPISLEDLATWCAQRLDIKEVQRRLEAARRTE